MSVNFAFLRPLDPNFDRIGGSAESHFRDEPDLALVSLRKIAELVVTGVASINSITLYDRELGKRISALRYDRRRHIPEDVADDLRVVSEEGNEGAHASFGVAFSQGNMQWRAARALQSAHRVCQWFHDTYGDGKPAPKFSNQFGDKPEAEVLEKTPNSYTDRMVQLSNELDEAERAIEEHRQEAKARQILEQVKQRLGSGPYQAELGKTSWQIPFCELRLESIELTIANHRGLQPPIQGVPKRIGERDDVLLREGRPEVLEEILLFHNRWAVGQLNAYFFSDAFMQLEEIVARRERALETSYGSAEVLDFQLGALLGTLGQAQAFMAYVERDVSELGAAVEVFKAARARFRDPVDQGRQDSYRAHAILDKIRLGAKPTREDLSHLQSMRPQLEQGVKDLLADPIPKRDWWRLFAPALAFKIGMFWPEGEIPGAHEYAQRLNEALEAPLSKADWYPQHPLQQICGYLAMELPQCPKRIREALGRAAKVDSLVGLIASIYSLVADKRHKPKLVTPERTAAFFKSFEDQEGYPAGLRGDPSMKARLEELEQQGDVEGTLSLLPLYYA